MQHLEATFKMHLTPNGCVSPINRDYTSIFMKIKVCIKPIRNARISRQDAAPTNYLENDLV
jgi:hypothetical protein